MISKVKKHLRWGCLRRHYHLERDDNGHESEYTACSKDTFCKGEVRGAKSVECNNKYDGEDREECASPSCWSVTGIVDHKERLNDVRYDVAVNRDDRLP